jgi:hypothetical protein
MSKPQSKALEFIYQDTQIHFLLSKDENVMVNATEMAKAFGKKVTHFLENEGTKNFINVCIKSRNPDFICINSESDLFNSRQKSGTYFHQILALKFAAWLDPEFELWIYSTIRDILFGHYKQHWDAHVKQEDAKKRMESLKKKLLNNPTQEDVIAYFEAEREVNEAKSQKQKAIQSQYRLFDQM